MSRAPLVHVVVEVAGARFLMDARITRLALDCGCWGHAAGPERAVELAISPEGKLLGMRTRTDRPFTVSPDPAGPIRIRQDDTADLATNTVTRYAKKEDSK